VVVKPIGYKPYTQFYAQLSTVVPSPSHKKSRI